MQVSDFDYFLPEELIAQEPIEKRDTSRLMLVNKDSDLFEHEYFYQMPKHLHRGDILVLNDTRVIPARLLGIKESTGARAEVFLLNDIGDNVWSALVRPAKRLKKGTVININGGRIQAEILEEKEDGERTIRLRYEGVLMEALAECGEMPLPPYIHKRLADGKRYQTVYARADGSVAAPTAGLHFTDALLEEISSKGVEIVYITLQVGIGTFRPVKTDTIEAHQLHSEKYILTAAAANKLNECKKNGGRIIAVGTTCVRTLESVAKDGFFHASSGYTDIFIYPGYKFAAIDGMITNFHLPKSTLLMLVSAFAGRERMLSAYYEAISMKYRFFSFGDAMMII